MYNLLINWKIVFLNPNDNDFFFGTIDEKKQRK